MKLIIDVDEKLVCEGFERTFTEEERDILIRAIGNGVKYVEPKKGEWIKSSNMSKKSYQRVCDQCHHISYFCGDGNYPNCPYCLADMREAEDV